MTCTDHVHQERERPVACRVCDRPTWNPTAVCDNHQEEGQ